MTGCKDLNTEQVSILKRFIENYDKGLRLCKCDIERVLELSSDTKKAVYRTIGPSEYVIPLQQYRAIKLPSYGIDHAKPE